MLKRAQYVGYTATPFANVFIDPDDSEDIFPKDFIVSLERPPGYMGARDFHDLDVDFGDDPKTIDNSNEKAFVRDLYAADEPDKRRAELQKALDSFVLTGALKLFRAHPGAEVPPPHDARARVRQAGRARGARERDPRTVAPLRLRQRRRARRGCASSTTATSRPVTAALHRRAVAAADTQGRARAGSGADAGRLRRRSARATGSARPST